MTYGILHIKVKDGKVDEISLKAIFLYVSTPTNTNSLTKDNHILLTTKVYTKFSGYLLIGGSIQVEAYDNESIFAT